MASHRERAPAGGTVSQLLFPMVIYLARNARCGRPNGRPLRTTAPYPPSKGPTWGCSVVGVASVPPAPSPARLFSLALFSLLPTTRAGFASVVLRRPALRLAPSCCRRSRQPSLDFPLAARGPPATIRPTCLVGRNARHIGTIRIYSIS